MGWGSGAWGSSPWGVATSEVSLVEAPSLSGVNIVSKSTLELVFSEPMKNNTALQSVSSYTITPFDSNLAQDVTILAVHTGEDVGENKIYLEITTPTPGGVYDVTVVGSVKDLSNDDLDSNTARFIARRTKVDSIVDSRPQFYDTRVGTLMRTIIAAIGKEDEYIGGSQDEGWEIFRTT